jgi:hypothetical protein
MGKEMQPKVESSSAAISKARGQMITMEDPDYIDLASCLKRLAAHRHIPGSLATTCRKALERARVAKSDSSPLCGLSLLFPQIDSYWVASRRKNSGARGKPLRANIAGLGKDSSWTGFLKEFSRP